MRTPKYSIGSLVTYTNGPESRAPGKIVDIVSENGNIYYKIEKNTNEGTIVTAHELSVYGTPKPLPPFVPRTPLNTSHLGPPPAWGSEPKPPTLYQTAKNKAGTLASAAKNKVFGLFGKSKRSTRKNKRRASRRRH